MTTTEQLVTEPGVYPDMPEDVYHADPVPGGSLSSTGARKLLPPKTPAHFDYDRRNPSASRPEFDLGKAFHTKVLGTGAEVEVCDFRDWKTKAAQEAKAAAYAAGKVPLLTHQAAQVEAMAAAVRRHDTAANLLHPAAGDPEQSLFWVDQATGVWCRARLDFLRNRIASGRVITVDLKSCESADWEHIQRAVARYGYHQQAPFYLDGVKALGLAEDPAFVFIFVEKEPPHLIRVVQLDPIALRIGRDLNRDALQTYAECTRTGRWPGYSDDIESIALPTWVERQHTKEIW